MSYCLLSLVLLFFYQLLWTECIDRGYRPRPSNFSMLLQKYPQFLGKYTRPSRPPFEGFKLSDIILESSSSEEDYSDTSGITDIIETTTYPQICYQINQTVNGVNIVWPEQPLGLSVWSTPLCLNETYKIIKRTCIFGDDGSMWNFEPNCTRLQATITNPCPTGLSYIQGKYCYTVIDNTVFPPQCPYQETLGWSKYSRLNLTKKPIWMPLKREQNQYYGVDVMRYTEITNNYGDPFTICTDSCKTYFYTGQLMESNCLIYHNSTHVEAVPCDSKYSAVCFYDVLPSRSSTLCSQIDSECVQSGYETRSSCFCKGDKHLQPEISSYDLVEFIQPFQNLLFKSVSTFCRIGLKNEPNKSPTWIKSNKSITYTNWNYNVDIDFDLNYGAYTFDGWELTDDDLDCVLYEKESSEASGELKLTYDTENSNFVLIISNSQQFKYDQNQKPLIYCFTDASSKSLIYRITQVTFDKIVNDNMVFVFDPLTISQSGPGNYWCEGFLYPNLDTITSNRFFLNNPLYQGEYVAILKLKNYTDKLSTNPVTPENLEMLQNLFKNEIPNYQSFYPRLFMVNKVDAEKHEITLTYHLSSAESIDSPEEYESLKGISRSQKIFEFIDFRSVHYCAQVVTTMKGKKMTWPLTAADSSNDTIGGYCIDDDGVVMQRHCIDDFISGAHWSDIPNCTFYEASDSSKQLKDIITSGDITVLLKSMSTVCELTENAQSFLTIDVLLIAKFLKLIANNKPDLQKLTGIVSNIMKVPEHILIDAQDNFKATDDILIAIDDALSDSDPGEWASENFIAKSINVDQDKFYGILLENCTGFSKSCSIVTIYGQPIVESQLKSDVFAAIYLSEDLQKQIMDYAERNSSYTAKIVISIFYGCDLFVGKRPFRFTSYVFGVLLPGFNEPFAGPLNIYYHIGFRKGTIDYNCSYWKFDETYRSDWEMEDTDDERSFIICKYYHVTHFALPFDKPDEDTLLSNELSSDTFCCDAPNETYCSAQNPFAFDEYYQNYFVNEPDYNNLGYDNSCIKKHQNILHNIYNLLLRKLLNHISVGDIKSIADELFTLEYIQEEETEVLANIINRVLQLPKSTLELSQEIYQSADKILASLDHVIYKINYDVEIYKEHVTFIIKSKQNSSGIAGFDIYSPNNVTVLNKNMYSMQNNLEMIARIVFSEKLMKQIEEYQSKIVLVIFYQDTLFPMTSGEIISRVVIDLLFPDIDTPGKGEFSIIYRHDNYRRNKEYCAYWNHVIENKKVLNSGSWRSEFPAVIKDHEAICTFTHTTHFTLIITNHNITTDLEFLLYSDLSSLDKLMEVELILMASTENLISVDISLISKIIANSTFESSLTNITSKIVSSLFGVPREVLRASQSTYSATDTILHGVDEMAKKSDDTLLSLSNFSLIVQNFQNKSVKAVIISDCRDNTCSIEMYGDYIDVNDYVDNKTVVAMVMLSEELVKQLSASFDPRLVITMYFNDDLFNEIDTQQETSRIFGVVFPGINTTLNGELYVVYGAGALVGPNNVCAFWDYDVNADQAGQWTKDFNKHKLKDFTICSFNHVTHFALLLANNDDYNDDTVLDIVTDIECILSLFGISVILFTAVVFRKWRQNTGNIILINFSVAITLKIVMLYVSEFVRGTSGGVSCTISGAILHYAILSECAWMLTIAILQFKRFVEVLGGPPKYVLLKALVCGWLFPVLPVVCVVVIDSGSYQVGQSGLCYPSDLSLFLGVWFPVLLIITINSVIFLFILYNVFHKKTECVDVVNHEILFQWRLALLLFFMLGLTWIFGFLGQIKNDTFFTYLFCITASLQGFVMFLFFIVFNKSTRLLYVQTLKQWFYSRGIFNVRGSSKDKY
ncbi:uncharacterized protein LOC143194713 isoform X1 [Rhynchophorus ferrugineus]|uniref:uncharacterized protein LOC143194713 isoform X1 n=1 Tax=Rhynchophorus ferrugineus TaxID=354439 RepID=UPI003FCDD5A9